MKLPPQTDRPPSSRHGSTLLIVLGLLGLMIAMVTADYVALRGLDREMKLIEKRQIHRLPGRPPADPAPAAGRPASRQN